MYLTCLVDDQTSCSYKGPPFPSCAVSGSNLYSRVAPTYCTFQASNHFFYQAHGESVGDVTVTLSIFCSLWLQPVVSFVYIRFYLCALIFWFMIWLAVPS
uniref:Uncharacterized protein n=1 Tax=Anguilla anguilla TaxID=7936 RepID=A0A0E9X058_ANGAN